jgi:formamidopyrimidine-DNA glycosylase
MPELPEVETVCQGLKDKVLNSKIIGVRKYRDNIRNVIPKNIEGLTLNSRITAIKRVAKYILIELDNQQTLIFHLGMSGKLFLSHAIFEKQKHDHFILDLDNELHVIFNDPRRFGIVDVANTSHVEHLKYFANLGVEPLSEKFNALYLIQAFSKKTSPIKVVLMDNHIVVGIGNIYAVESLFRSNIHPSIPANLLTFEQTATLVKHIKQVLMEAIAAGGSSLKDYVNSQGEKGYFQNNFFVYNKEGEPCSICNTKIGKIQQGGRSSFFCSSCQKF